MAFASLTANLRLNIADFSAKMSSASKQMTDFAKGLNDSYGKANASLRSHNLGLKDTARIVQGILVSQTFYAAAGSIRDATASLWEFNKALDYANVTYSALFGDASLASDFMKVLQEHAINTMFDYQDLTDASKKLLAYGIEYENLMFIMEGLTNLGAMSGDAAALDRISLALGQIYTKGKLSAEEMRQLSNAYVPISDIIQEKFGLSEEDMGRVGDLNLPAEEVINAIVDYANERFGSVGDAAMYTITGIQAKIVDTLKVVGTEMLASTTTAYKSFLVYISEGLDAIRNEYASGGIGGVFEYLVPDKETQTIIRQFVANVRNLFMSLMSVGVVAGQVFGNFAYVIATAFNMVSPLIVGFTNFLAGLMHAMLETSTGAKILRVALVAAAGAFVVLRVQAAAALVVTAVTKAVIGLAKALMILASLVVRHPILMLMAGLAIALTGVSVASSNANKSIMGLFDTLSGAAGGFSQEDVLQKIEKEVQGSADAADQFNNRLGEGADAAEELEEGINGAGKAAKKAAGLLSFDEVFKLNQPTDAGSGGAGSGIVDDIGSLIGGLGALGDALIPDIPDFTDFINGFTDDLFGGILDKIKTIASGALTGALVGGLAGFAIGGLVTRSMAGALAGAKLGSKIGAAAGAGFATFWEDTYKQVEDALLRVVVGAGSGALLGALTGFIIGAFATRTLAGAISGSQIGGAIGAAVGGLIGGVFDDATKIITDRINQIRLGAAEGTLTGALAGFIIGAFATKSLGGAIAGARIGAGLGTLIGGVVGGVFGDAEATVSDAISNMFANVKAASNGALVGGLVGMIIGAIVGAFAGGIGALPGAKIGATIGSAMGSLGSLVVSYLENSGITESFADWLENVYVGITDFFSNVDASVSEWYVDTMASVDDWVANTRESISTWFSDVKKGFRDWKEETTKDLALWVIAAAFSFQSWKNETLTNLSNWWSETKTGFTNWKTDVSNKLSTWWSDSKTGFNNWKTETTQRLSTWRTETVNSVSSWYTESKRKFTNWWSETKTGFSTWKTETGEKISTWATNAYTNIRNSFDKIDQKIGEFLRLDVSFSTFCTNTLRSIADWASNIWRTVSDKFTSAINKVREFLNINTTAANVRVPVANYGTVGNYSMLGHATGGIFTKEHIARFAEGNKAEAVIPLENASAMQPFVDAIANGIVSSLAPIIVHGGNSNSNQLPPMYIGTLVADDRGLKELYKKFEIIQVQENARRGTT